MNINSKDAKGDTPLHWAAYFGADNSAQFLLSQKSIEIDVQDNQG